MGVGVTELSSIRLFFVVFVISLGFFSMMPVKVLDKWYFAEIFMPTFYLYEIVDYTQSIRDILATYIEQIPR